jgi:hypothetical protein
LAGADLDLFSLENASSKNLSIIKKGQSMLPNFLVVGAQKAGTTSLHNYLCSHPDIYLPRIKETKFFVADERFAKGLHCYEADHFSAWHGEQAIGEIDPDYMYFDQALERMVVNLDLRTMKFIFVLRNPVDRAFSHYLMSVRRGVEELSFEEAAKVESERISKDYLSKMHFSYVSRGFYLPQIQRFLAYANKSSMLFILSEDLKKNTNDVLTSCYRFLEVEEALFTLILMFCITGPRSPEAHTCCNCFCENRWPRKYFGYLSH